MTDSERFLDSPLAGSKDYDEPSVFTPSDDRIARKRRPPLLRQGFEPWSLP
jgi:hypothetical protein